ncbi:MAG: hypothetical protein LAT83_20705 [Kiritimatiellae bacterium]|nr:hypothetical protein [Kiritimatiellia bacterium]
MREIPIGIFVTIAAVCSYTHQHPLVEPVAPSTHSRVEAELVTMEVAESDLEVLGLELTPKGYIRSKELANK